MFLMWVMASNIAIGVYVLDMWSVLCIWVVGLCSNKVFEMSVLDMWSVLCVPYMDGGI